MMLLLLFILGLCVGSFLNVLADRLPKGEDVIKGRSHCDYCKHTLRWFELIPLASFFLQSGKSRCCKKRLSIKYPIVELITGLGFVWIYQSVQIPVIPGIGAALIPGMALVHFALYLILSLGLFSLLLVICIADLTYEIIPMEMIIAGFIFAGIYRIISFINFISGTNFVLSALGAGLFFFGIWLFTKGKAMGDGDIYLAALIGFLTGFPDIIISLYAAFLTGAVVGIILILGWKKSLRAHIPFGPFLIIGYGITLLWGQKILEIWRLLW